MKRWLLGYIERSFSNVQLGTGMTIYTGESQDRYGDPAEELKSSGAERSDWRRVPVSDLLSRSAALSFLDAEGFRFYTPAIMTIVIQGTDDLGNLTESFMFHLHDIRASCRVRDTPYCVLYNRSQRAAIIRFVKYLVYNVPFGRSDKAMQKTLTGLPKCCGPSHNGG